MEFRRILIVDDSAAILNLLRRALEQTGYEVITAKSGEEALAAFEREEPDAIVLDLNLPGLPGWEVCRLLKIRSEVPIIIITGNASLQLATRDKTQGADAYLLKPFHLETLFETLHTVLAQHNVTERGADHVGRYPRVTRV
jgi:DNA-binding response OmpR family regulator